MEKALEIQRRVAEILGTDEVYLVGGSVRDVFLGKEPKDYDFTTPLLPEEVKERVKAAGRHPYTIGERFGTIGFKVAVPQEGSSESDFMYASTVPYVYVEVTTYRSEVYTSKSRKPEVKFVPSLDEDLARRDFTFNAMVLKPDGTIYDPYSGQLDIIGGLIRTVGVPKDRITEDPLRMLRAARFASQLDFEVDANMLGKMKQVGSSILNVSKERWVQELDKMLVGKNPGRGLQVLMQTDLAKYILPEVYLALSEEEGLRVTLETFNEYPDMDVDSAWGCLFSFIGYPYTYAEDKRGNVTFKNHDLVRRELLEGICARLKFSNDRRDTLLKNRIVFKTIDL